MGKKSGHHSFGSCSTISSLFLHFRQSRLRCSLSWNVSAQLGCKYKEEMHIIWISSTPSSASTSMMNVFKVVAIWLLCQQLAYICQRDSPDIYDNRITKPQTSHTKDMYVYKFQIMKMMTKFVNTCLGLHGTLATSNK